MSTDQATDQATPSVRRFSQLSASDIAQLNEQAREQISVDFVTMTFAQVAEKMQIREAEKDELPQFVYKGKRYISEVSKTNRPIDMKSVQALAQLMKAGRWACNGEPFIWDENGQTASLQHRGSACWIVAQDPNLADQEISFIEVTGVPAELVDTIDTGRSRTQKDIFARDPNVLAMDNLTNMEGQNFADAAPNVRKKQIADLTGALRLILLRAQGKNVKSGGSTSQGNLNLAHALFESAEGNQIEELVQVLYRQDVGLADTASWSKEIGRNYVAAALALYFNSGLEAWEFDSGTLKHPTDLPVIDLEKAKEFAKGLSMANNDQDSKLYPFLSELKRAKGVTEVDGKRKKSSKKNLDKNYEFHALCLAVQYFFDDIEQPNNFVPKDGSIKSAYLAFGGLDQGYKETKRGKSDE